MTATLALKPAEKTAPAPAEAPIPVAETVAEPDVGASLKIVLPTTMLVVFVGVLVAFVIGGTPTGEALGYAAYLSFWIGGGFGAILSGAIWSQKAMGH